MQRSQSQELEILEWQESEILKRSESEISEQTFHLWLHNPACHSVIRHCSVAVICKIIDLACISVHICYMLCTNNNVTRKGLTQIAS